MGIMETVNGENLIDNAENIREKTEKDGAAGFVIAVIVSVCLLFILLITASLKTALKNPYVQAVLRGLKPCVIGIVLATGVYMILKNGAVMAETGLLIKPLILTVILAAVYFGSRKIKKGGISPILLICISALAGIAAYSI